MSLRLYATEYTTHLSSELFSVLFSRLPEDLRQKITRFRRWEDAHAALLGKHLLRIALRQAGASDDLTRLRYTAQDRPWLPEAPDFNISHSGNRVVCLVNTSGRVGIDIEVIKPLDFEDFQTQFTLKEWNAIRGDADPVAAFYRFWTAKESLIKADGRGLQIPLQEIDLSGTILLQEIDLSGTILPQEIDLSGTILRQEIDLGATPILTLGGVGWSVHSLPRFQGYACHFTIESSPGSSPGLSPGPSTLPPVEFHELAPAAIAGF